MHGPFFHVTQNEKDMCEVCEQQRQAFDPGDPMDAMAESFRTQIMQIALDAYKVAIYRDLNPQKQLECFLGGALTAIVGVCFSSVKSDGYDAIMEYLAQCLPAAREMAESMKGTDGLPIVNRHG